MSLELTLPQKLYPHILTLDYLLCKLIFAKYLELDKHNEHTALCADLIPNEEMA